MTDQEIEDFICYLDKKYKDYCVYEDGRNLDCCDCTLCRITFLNQVREDLKGVTI